MIVIALLLLSGVFLWGYSTGLGKATKDMKDILGVKDEEKRSM